MTQYDRKEVEAAYQNFVAVGDSGDWNAWADLHTEDGVWVEHHLGTFEGREAIRKAILDVMKPVPMMFFPVGWRAIEGTQLGRSPIGLGGWELHQAGSRVRSRGRFAAPGRLGLRA